MLAETRPQSFSEPGWLFEIKYDGFRALAAHEGGRGKLLYRHGRRRHCAVSRIWRRRWLRCRRMWC